jgi:hypothetical protein
MQMNEPAKNTDKEIWREKPDDYYSPSISVTAFGSIAINVGGHVFVKDVRAWHKLASEKLNRDEVSLMEKGDIMPAIQLLLTAQAGYARQEQGFTRAMRDVAMEAVEREIERYVESRLKPYKTAPPKQGEPS